MDQSLLYENPRTNTKPNSPAAEKEKRPFIARLITFFAYWFLLFPFDMFDLTLYLVFDILDILIAKLILMPIFAMFGYPTKRQRVSVFRYFTPTTVIFCLCVYTFIYHEEIVSEAIDSLIVTDEQVDKRLWSVSPTEFYEYLEKLDEKLLSMEDEFQRIYELQKELSLKLAVTANHAEGLSPVN